jgi:hypothetical protein
MNSKYTFSEFINEHKAKLIFQIQDILYFFVTGELNQAGDWLSVLFPRMIRSGHQISVLRQANVTEVVYFFITRPGPMQRYYLKIGHDRLLDAIESKALRVSLNTS